MVITCPSCSSRYQLADSKIKETGTKVRCPRCSHTFMVFPHREEDNQSDRTELFMDRGQFFDADSFKQSGETTPKADNVNTAPPSKPTPKEEPKPDLSFEPAFEKHDDKFDGYDSLFDEKTMVSVRPPVNPDETMASEKNKKISPTPPPIEEDIFGANPDEETPQAEPESIPMGNDEALNDSQEANFQVDSESEEVRPFGDATLFEIKKSGKSQKKFKLGRPLKIAAGFLILGGISYFIFQNIDSIQNSFQKLASTQKTESPEPEQIISLNRPSGWYRDEPQIYQDTLAQIAALPKSNQEKPENRALLSEALILNGLLTGATDQVNKGLSYIPVLVINYPSQALSLYGSADYAIWNNDQDTMKDLLSRWPQSQREDPEFKLLEVAEAYRSENLEKAFNLSVELMKAKPNFQRATNYIYRMILQKPDVAKKYFQEDQIKKISNLYQRYRKNLQPQIADLPSIHEEIDKLLKISEPKPPVKKEAEKPLAKPAPKTEAKPKTPPPAPVARAKKSEKKVEETKPKKKVQTRLPKPDPELVAANKAEEASKEKAESLLKKGNQQFEQGDTEGALQSYQEALKMDESLAEVWKQKGKIHMARKESQRALRSFKMYLLLKPQTEDKQLVEGWIKSLQ